MCKNIVVLPLAAVMLADQMNTKKLLIYYIYKCKFFCIYVVLSLSRSLLQRMSTWDFEEYNISVTLQKALTMSDQALSWQSHISLQLFRDRLCKCSKKIKKKKKKKKKEGRIKFESHKNKYGYYN